MTGLFSRALAVLVLSGFFWAAGCTQVKVPDQIGNSLRTLRGEIQLGRGNVERTTASLRDLRAARGALTKQAYATYLTQLAALEEKAGGVQAVGAITDSTAASFFQQWEKQLNDIRDAEVGQGGRQRRADVMNAFDNVKAKMEDIRPAYRPYITSLRDIKTYLDADMTDQGLAAARPAMDKAIRLEPEVLKKIDATIKAIDDIVHP